MPQKGRMDICVSVEIEPTGKKTPTTMTIRDKKTGQPIRQLHGLKDKRTRKNEKDLRTALEAELPEFPLLEGAVVLHILAVHKRPKTLSKEVKSIMKALDLPIKPDRLVWCLKPPDIDNIRKSVQDALKAIWRDDKQVVLGTTLKAYGRVGDRPYIMIRLTDRMPSPEVAAHMAGLPVLERRPPAPVVAKEEGHQMGLLGQ